MSTINGTYTNGVIRLDTPTDLVEGQKVKIQTIVKTDQLGCSTEEWDNSAEGIEAWLNWYDSLEPLMLTASDLAIIAASRDEQRRFECENWVTKSEVLRKSFE